MIICNYCVISNNTINFKNNFLTMEFMILMIFSWLTEPCHGGGESWVADRERE